MKGAKVDGICVAVLAHEIEAIHFAAGVRSQVLEANDALLVVLLRLVLQDGLEARERERQAARDDR